MKHLICEGGDALGKNMIISKLTNYFNFDNVTIRHFGKPPTTFPEGVDPLYFQFECFNKEVHLMRYLRQSEKDIYNYYENILIWNRSHLGEFVYSQMFRGQDPKKVKDQLDFYEECNLINNPDETFLILLTASPDFFYKQEDGNSFSKNLEEKTRELELFEEAFENSIIDRKLMIKVDKDGKFIPKEEVLNQVFDFIKL